MSLIREVRRKGSLIKRFTRNKYREIERWFFEYKKGRLYEKTLPELSDAVASEGGLGEDAICGAAISAEDIYDRNLMALVKKHFNAVTLENELKPGAVLGYYPVCLPAVRCRTIVWEGQDLVVPVPDHTKADRILDVLVKWNSRHPDKKILVRGHTLVWHAQTPEWFFHENYDKRRPYVSRELMDRRLQWYIHEMMDYYTASDSPYYGLFYGWDVVNDAASNHSNVWRTDKEPGSDLLTDDWHTAKSGWWAVYGDEQYVVNAFRYANQYAPAEVKLYYNDHSEWHEQKAQRIIRVLRTIRENSGPPGQGTRIDGLGLQGHYKVNHPDIQTLREKIVAYAHEVDSIMLTELDVKADISFDGSQEAKETEYAHQAEYYKDLNQMLCDLKDQGIQVNGITFWGVIDSKSWLQTRQEIGGGSDGRMSHCPLLFDENYKAKPAFWAFVHSVIGGNKEDDSDR